MLRKQNKKSIHTLKPWVEAIASMNEVCDPAYDGIEIEEYKALLLGKIALDHHNSGATRTVIGARIVVARVLDDIAREYEGFPAYGRTIFLHDAVIGPVLGFAFGLIREHRLLKQKKEYLKTL